MPSYSSAGATWTTWIDTGFSTSTATTWTNWVYATSSATTSTDYVWTRWVSSNSVVLRYVAPAESEAQRQARERAAQEREQSQREANARAEQLLMEALSPEEQAELREHQHLTVINGASQRRYRLKRGSVYHNVEELDAEGVPIRTFCIHPREAVPHDDALLAQKLMLEHQEDEFRSRAVVNNLRRAG